jgi:Ala-tRNA(Pro) deacylase
MMAYKTRVTQYLDNEHIKYSVVPHSHSKSSIGSAISAEVPMHQIAKAVMLEDHEGRNLMAIVPADYKISLAAVGEELHRQFRLVKEAKVYEMFDDCDQGAVPPMPAVYHVDAVYDEELAHQRELYLESGDHETLVQLKQADFIKLMESYKHSRFSRQVIH